MEQSYAKSIANIIWEQIKADVETSVIWSWGLHELAYTTIKPGNAEMPALTFLVRGFNFKGRIWIALNEGDDLYEIYGHRHGSTKGMQLLRDQVFYDVLGTILDELIETGGKGEEFYSKPQTVASTIASTIKGEPV